MLWPDSTYVSSGRATFTMIIIATLLVALATLYWGT